MTIFMHEFYFSIVLIFRAVTGLGPPPGSALKPNVELELQESDLTEELQDSGNKIYFSPCWFSVAFFKFFIGNFPCFGFYNRDFVRVHAGWVQEKSN